MVVVQIYLKIIKVNGLDNHPYSEIGLHLSYFEIYYQELFTRKEN